MLVPSGYARNVGNIQVNSSYLINKGVIKMKIGIDYLDCKISQEWAYYKTHPIRRKGILNRLKKKATPHD